MRTRRRVEVEGRVQGVFFRDACRTTAEARGVAGWVRNLPDGRVEAVFEGTAEQVGDLVGWARAGPPAAEVSAVTVHEEEPEGLARFEVRGTP
ncbi:acylphosphatase [Streptomyces sp. ACA25]|uniref:acylphosphatase n=1 Tax=Streptomyces sp. ACA25 TaxID=3022596 RepID=UPI0023077B32|nr:acylphosphatase [Streptomyces sp. ACA25]MDB1089849.1 acylphosphatase [Streptomyces sp. ACA25]